MSETTPPANQPPTPQPEAVEPPIVPIEEQLMLDFPNAEIPAPDHEITVGEAAIKGLRKVLSRVARGSDAINARIDNLGEASRRTLNRITGHGEVESTYEQLELPFDEEPEEPVEPTGPVRPDEPDEPESPRAEKVGLRARRRVARRIGNAVLQDEHAGPHRREPLLRTLKRNIKASNAKAKELNKQPASAERDEAVAEHAEHLDTVTSEEHILEPFAGQARGKRERSGGGTRERQELRGLRRLQGEIPAVPAHLLERTDRALMDPSLDADLDAAEPGGGLRERIAGAVSRQYENLPELDEVYDSLENLSPEFQTDQARHVIRDIRNRIEQGTETARNKARLALEPFNEEEARMRILKKLTHGNFYRSYGGDSLHMKDLSTQALLREILELDEESFQELFPAPKPKEKNPRGRDGGRQPRTREDYEDYGEYGDDDDDDPEAQLAKLIRRVAQLDPGEQTLFDPLAASDMNDRIGQLNRDEAHRRKDDVNYGLKPGDDGFVYKLDDDEFTELSRDNREAVIEAHIKKMLGDKRVSAQARQLLRSYLFLTGNKTTGTGGR